MYMNEIEIFNNLEFGKVRVIYTVADSGAREPWFVGKDVADALGYSDTSDAIKRHVDPEDKGVGEIPTPGGRQAVTIINESGLYSLVFSSRLESAKRFKRWVTSEVLPSIRKRGMYATPQTLDEMRKDPAAFVKLLRDYADEVDRNQALQNQVAIQNQQILEMEPKVTYYDIVLQCKNAIPITQIAKDYGWTANEMNKKLHNLGIQYHVNKTWVLYKGYAGMGYTKSKTYPVPGTTYCNVVTQWTQKGRLFIYALLKQEGYLPICER